MIFLSFCSLALYVSLSLTQCLSPSLELSLLSPAESVSLGSSQLVFWDLRLPLSVSIFCLCVFLHPISASVLCLCLHLSSDLLSVMLSVSLPVCLSLSHSAISLSIPVSVCLCVHLSTSVPPAPALLYVALPVFSTCLFSWTSLTSPMDVSISVSQKTQQILGDSNS